MENFFNKKPINNNVTNILKIENQKLSFEIENSNLSTSKTSFQPLQNNENDDEDDNEEDDEKKKIQIVKLQTKKKIKKKINLQQKKRNL